jgi:hypothetical protein
MKTERDHPLHSAPAAAATDLIEEIRRYLETVDVFRDQGCEPQWRDGRVPEPERSRSVVSAP